MPYSSKRGRRPMEYASKSSHIHIINDPVVQEFLKTCELPKVAEQIELTGDRTIELEPPDQNPIKHVIAVDGGFQPVQLRDEFPSSEMWFYQFGALIFSIDDLEKLEDQPFIDPDDISKLKQIQRLKLALPVRNVIIAGQVSLTHSVRVAIRNFFSAKTDNSTLMDTLKWLIFQEYSTPVNEWVLSSCPTCNTRDVALRRREILPGATFKCPNCGSDIYLTDVFRLHEAIDDELGAGGIVSYVGTTIEQLIIVHLIRLILETKPDLLNHILFIKDGPLAFFGQTANMHKPLRDLVKFLLNNHSLFLAGLEKTGAFVEHADQIASKLGNGRVLLLSNDYIYRYIIPGSPEAPYGRTTYYGNKLIFKTKAGRMFVVTLPTQSVLLEPKEEDFANLHAILENVEKLKCDMYDDALIPVALVNKLVSLADHPSTKILQRFALSQISR